MGRLRFRGNDQFQNFQILDWTCSTKPTFGRRKRRRRQK
jgi:hypothetical protein